MAKKLSSKEISAIISKMQEEATKKRAKEIEANLKKLSVKSSNKHLRELASNYTKAANILNKYRDEIRDIQNQASGNTKYFSPAFTKEEEVFEVLIDYASKTGISQYDFTKIERELILGAIDPDFNVNDFIANIDKYKVN